MSKTFAACALCLGVLGACKNHGSEPEKKPATPPVGSGAQGSGEAEQGTGAGPYGGGDQVAEITADAAKAKGLPPVGMRVDARNSNLALTQFPEAEMYLIASGPPGGPLLAIVWSTEEHEGDAAAVERAVRKHYSADWQKPLVIGAPATVTLSGASRAALSFTTGTELRYTGWCGAVVTGKTGSVLVALGITPASADAKPTCAEVLAEPNLAVYARTFALLP